MRPWDILGWALVAVLLFRVACWLFVVGTKLNTWTSRRWKHYRTRRIPPVEGQVWMQGNTRLTIGKDYGTHINIQTSGYGSSASWGDTPDAWQSRVKHLAGSGHQGSPRGEGMSATRFARNPVDYHDFHLFALTVGELRIAVLEAVEDGVGWLLRRIGRRRRDGTLDT